MCPPNGGREVGIGAMRIERTLFQRKFLTSGTTPFASLRYAQAVADPSALTSAL